MVNVLKNYKYRIIMIAVLAAALLGAVAQCAHQQKPDFCIAYIGYNDIDTMEVEAAKEVFYPYLEDLNDNGKIDLELVVLHITPGQNDLVNSQVALAQLIGGRGVLYIADIELVRSIVNDDSLFEPVYGELYLSAEGSGLLERAHIDPSGMSVFVRSANIENEEMCAFIRARQPMAKKLIEAITES